MLLRYIKDTPIVYTLIIINIIVFAIIKLQPDMKNTLALWLPIHTNYQHWQWLTSIFSHKRIGHLFFNMFALWSFGLAVYYRLGTAKFLLIYLLSAFAGSALHLLHADYQLSQNIAQLMQYGLTETQIYQKLATGQIHALEQSREIARTVSREYWQNVIGASGAVFGILTAFARLYPNHQLELLFIPKPIKAKYFVAFMVMYELFAQVSGWSIFGRNIAHLAHIGGAIVGFILADLCLRLKHHLN